MNKKMSVVYRGKKFTFTNNTYFEHKGHKCTTAEDESGRLWVLVLGDDNPGVVLDAIEIVLCPEDVGLMGRPVGMPGKKPKPRRVPEVKVNAVTHTSTRPEWDKAFSFEGFTSVVDSFIEPQVHRAHAVQDGTALVKAGIVNAENAALYATRCYKLGVSIEEYLRIYEPEVYQRLCDYVAKHQKEAEKGGVKDG